MVTVLSKAKRAEILMQCLKSKGLIHYCNRSSRVLNLPPQDILADVSEHMYRGLFYFRFTKRLTVPGVPFEEQAFRLALQTGYNALRDMIRAAKRRKTMIKEGLGNPIFEIPEVVSDDRIRTIIVRSTMIDTAKQLVGIARADALLGSTKHDWTGAVYEPEKRTIMRRLKIKNGKNMREMIDKFADQVRAGIEPEPMPVLKQNDGVWRTAPRRIA